MKPQRKLELLRQHDLSEDEAAELAEYDDTIDPRDFHETMVAALVVEDDDFGWEKMTIPGGANYRWHERDDVVMVIGIAPDDPDEIKRSYHQEKQESIREQEKLARVEANRPV